MRCRVPRQPRSHSSARMGQKAGPGVSKTGRGVTGVVTGWSQREEAPRGTPGARTWLSGGDAGVLVETHKKENLILEER